MSTASVLAIFNPSKETELHTDACRVGYGAILTQRQEDGRFHPTYYFSKATSPEDTDCSALSQTFDKKNMCPIIAR